MIKTITKRLQKQCAICDKKMSVIIYNDKSYRGGHNFGKIPLHTKRAWKDALSAGTRTVQFAGGSYEVMKKDPVVYGYKEYWECPNCYWRG